MIRTAIIEPDEDAISLAGQFNNPKFSDIGVAAGGGIFYAHRAVLCKLPYFRAVLNSKMSGNYDPAANVLHLKVPELVLRLILRYLYEVPAPLADIRLNGSTVVDLFEELVPFRYQAILQDLWDTIISNLDWNSLSAEEMANYYTKGCMYKLSMPLKGRVTINLMSRLNREVMLYLLKQKMEGSETQVGISKFILGGLWCATHAEKKLSSHDDRLEVAKATVALTAPTPDLIKNVLMKAGYCPAWNYVVAKVGDVKSGLDDVIFDVDKLVGAGMQPRCRMNLPIDFGQPLNETYGHVPYENLGEEFIQADKVRTKW